MVTINRLSSELSASAFASAKYMLRFASSTKVSHRMEQFVLCNQAVWGFESGKQDVEGFRGQGDSGFFRSTVPL